ncbi:hypothetical protein [Actinacidiphila oryziradicis]|uniref:hypothetical protein n=1 Tax=Actinacidiphila oryziradicis TaxID=2571141 RepID=UPI0023F22139|nr:hypothetical protein [Actinacidiphila oryziradicis]MCW2873727.1 hypothetical protein [Actinacidiphila oryziradicis]
MITPSLSADTFWTRIDAWSGEDSHRGRLVRAFRANMGQRMELQARRMMVLVHYVEQDAGRAPKIKGLQYAA